MKIYTLNYIKLANYLKLQFFVYRKQEKSFFSQIHVYHEADQKCMHAYNWGQDIANNFHFMK